MTRAFVHLSDLFGDHEDVLGLRRAFLDRVESYRQQGERVVVVDIAPQRIPRAQYTEVSGDNTDVRALEDVDWRDPAFVEVSVDCTSAHESVLAEIDRELVACGFVRAGRPWGEAGSSRRYLRPGSLSDRLRALKAQTQVRAGNAVVSVRDSWLTPDVHRRRRIRVKARLSAAHNTADLLDDDSRELDPPRLVHIRDLMPAKALVMQEDFHVALDTESSPWELASKCREQHGVWPISFSYPKSPLNINSKPTQTLADIVPGFPYSFDNEFSYMRTYHKAYLGLTQRKAGWDCFRHVEILAAGCVPLMPDAPEIPEFSMVHYPKRAMAVVAKQFRLTGGVPDSSTRRSFRQHFDQFLTSRAMAEYILKAAGLVDVQKVLFVDAALVGAADYQSVLTLLGMKQLLGANCHVMHPVDYIYSDTNVDTARLYGRGFGYTGILDPELRSTSEQQAARPPIADFDALIVGSISRNGEAAARLRGHFPPERTVWIHGEDTPPTLEQARFLRQSRTNVFIRAIHTNRR